MPELAQTNVQLIRQVVAAGWCDDDIARLRTAYELEIAAFSGLFRTNGKPEIDHHVGTASALTVSGERPALVIAGLLHSLYYLGEFGSGRRGAHTDVRAGVRRMFGTEIERLVACYPEAEWGWAWVEKMTADAPRATPFDRDLVALRVANAVDEFADYGMRLSTPHRVTELVGEDAARGIAELADAYGLAQLGTWLRDEAARSAASSVPEALVGSVDKTVFVPPASYRRRFHVALQDSRLGHRITETIPGVRRVGVWVRGRVA